MGNFCICQYENLKENISEQNSANFSYKAVSELSDATDDVQQESIGEQEMAELDDYEALLQGTKQKTKILSTDFSDEEESKQEMADEFLRNFFIKFGMNRTLKQFQTEWYELNALGQLNREIMPQIPAIYKRNQELTDSLADL